MSTDKAYLPPTLRLGPSDRFILLMVNVRDASIDGQVGVDVEVVVLTRIDQPDDGESDHARSGRCPRDDDRVHAEAERRRASLTEGADQVRLLDLVPLLQAQDRVGHFIRGEPNSRIEHVDRGCAADPAV